MPDNGIDDGGKTGIKCGLGLTKQSFKEEVDINNIVAQFLKNGEVPMNRFNKPGENLDLSSALDFKASLDLINRSRSIFSELSAQVRARFENDPAKFLAFMDDAKNVDEAIKLGLVKGPEPVPAPMKVEVVNPLVTAADADKDGSGKK